MFSGIVISQAGSRTENNTFIRLRWIRMSPNQIVYLLLSIVSDLGEIFLCAVAGRVWFWKIILHWFGQSCIVVLINCGTVSCVALNHFLTWMFYRRGCRGWQFLPNDLLQCDLSSSCHGLLFHILCTCKLADVHLLICFRFSPSMISLFLQVLPCLQKGY